jgi:hypothetical protein
MFFAPYGSDLSIIRVARSDRLCNRFGEGTKKNKKGHAQHIAFVLQFGKFCGLNRMFLNGDLR